MISVYRSSETKLGEKRKLRAARGSGTTARSPNQVLTHAARAAAKQLNKPRAAVPRPWPRAARAARAKGSG